MEIFFLIFIIILTFGIIFLHYKKNHLLNNLKDKEKAKDILNSLGKKGDYFVKLLNEKYPSDEGINLMVQRFNPKSLEEGNPFDKDMTYTENKGEKIVMCLRDSSNLKLHDENLLMYPFLHELAHLCDKNYDPNHGQNFKKYFNLLLKEANECGIYQAIDLSRPIKYCNMYIHN